MEFSQGPSRLLSLYQSYRAAVCAVDRCRVRLHSTAFEDPRHDDVFHDLMHAFDVLAASEVLFQVAREEVIARVGSGPWIASS